MRTLVFKHTERDTPLPELPLAALLEKRRIVSGAVPGREAKGGPLITFDETAWLEVLAEAARDLRHERVGVFYGAAATEGTAPWIHVSHTFAARTTAGTAVHVELDAEAWADVHAQAAANGVDTRRKRVVGWWHTHPDLGAFYSGTDRHTQARAFPRPWQFGLVLDPVRNETAFFRGGDSRDIHQAPLIVSRHPRPEPWLPHAAMMMPLPEDAADLGAAAWSLLARARLGTAFEPFERRGGAARSGLIFDRPLMKRRHPAARLDLSTSGLALGRWRSALALRSDDVACALVRGVIRPAQDLLSGRHP